VYDAAPPTYLTKLAQKKKINKNYYKINKYLFIKKNPCRPSSFWIVYFCFAHLICVDDDASWIYRP
jgi:hypothetical protein